MIAKSSNGRPRIDKRICGRCKRLQHLSQFDVVVIRGVQKTVCDLCVIEVNTRCESQRKRLISKHPRPIRLTTQEYQQLLQDQLGVCKICKTKPPIGIRLNNDHCHQTGITRGLLCSECNTGIGMFEDNPDLLRAAIAYLEKNNGERNKESSRQEFLDGQSST